jgi:hypothetical protein
MRTGRKRARQERRSISWGIPAIGLFVAVALYPLAAKNPVMEQEPAYNPATVIDFFTNVAEIHQVPLGNPLAGLHLEAKMKGKIDIYIAPSDFAEKYEMVFNKGDAIHVVGSKVKVGDADVILAREVTIGKYDRKGEFFPVTSLYMRDDEGPFWSR